MSAADVVCVVTRREYGRSRDSNEDHMTFRVVNAELLATAREAILRALELSPGQGTQWGFMLEVDGTKLTAAELDAFCDWLRHRAPAGLYQVDQWHYDEVDVTGDFSNSLNRRWVPFLTALSYVAVEVEDADNDVRSVSLDTPVPLFIVSEFMAGL